MSPNQRRLWLQALMTHGEDTLHLPIVWRIDGPVDHPALAAALESIARRHQPLRTVFPSDPAEPTVSILDPSEDDVQLHLVDRPSAEDAIALARAWCSQQFDFDAGPLVRAMLIRIDAHDHLLSIVLHHLIADGHSLNVLSRELKSGYGAALMGTITDDVTPSEFQYQDYVRWTLERESDARFRQHVVEAARRLAGFPQVLDMPIDHPRQIPRSSVSASISLHVDTTQVRKLERLAATRNCTLYMTVLSAWAAALASWTGQRRILIGTGVSNRVPATEWMIGPFINRAVLKVNALPEASAVDLMSEARDATLDALEFADVDFGDVVRALQPPRLPGVDPVVQHVFTWTVRPASFSLVEATFVPVDLGFDRIHCDLNLTLGPGSDGLSGHLTYRTGLFDARTIESVRRLFSAGLDEMLSV